MERGRKLKSSKMDQERGYLRPAENADMDLLFEWANEPFVRKNSFSSGKICYEEHKRWFEEFLKNKDCQQYIYMYKGKEAGQVRIIVDREKAEIGYSICAAMRGQGHGKRILELVCEQVKKDFPKVQKIIGKVKTENTASQKSFIKAGFEETYTVFELQMATIQKKKRGIKCCISEQT